MKILTKHIGLSLTVVLVASALVTGCNSSAGGDADFPALKVQTVSHALTHADSCEGLETLMREAASQQMHMLLAGNYQNAMQWAKESRNDDFGRNFGGDEEVALDASGEPNADGDGGGGSDFSGTNVQELGVDEGDLVKTDGDYLYIVKGGELAIVSVDPAGMLGETGSVPVAGFGREMFLYGDVAVVFSSLEAGEVSQKLRDSIPEAPPIDFGGGGFAEPMVDVEGFPGGGGYYQFTQVAVIDLTDRSTPQIVRTLQYPGNYVSSRLVGSAMRAVVSTSLPGFNLPSWPYDYDYDNQDSVDAAFADLYNTNMEYINALTLENTLPGKVDMLAGEEVDVEQISACSEIYLPLTPAGTQLQTIVSIDLDDMLGERTDISVVAEQGLVYASLGSLYLTTSTQYVLWAVSFGLWDQETSGIHKFDIATDASKAIYKATGKVKGRLLNQFSLGEHDGFLRVGTTSGAGWWEENTLDNHLSVFEEKDGVLKEVARLNGIGVGEEIYAARFVGDRGFMVTFFQTDPLFTFDLSDPYDPKVVGEWMGPGFSTYLHPIGEDLLLSIGLEDWRVAFSVYDLSDFEDPTLVQRLYLPDSMETEAVYDHKAFTFAPGDGDLFAFPYQDWSSEATGLLLYNVDETGLEPAGMSNLNLDSSREENTRRGVFIGDNLYNVSRCRVTSTATATPNTVIDDLPLYNEQSYCEEYWEGYY